MVLHCFLKLSSRLHLKNGSTRLFEHRSGQSLGVRSRLTVVRSRLSSIGSRLSSIGSRLFSAGSRLSCKSPLRVALLAITLGLSGCASTNGAEQPTDPDPWENINRKVFEFNEVLDRNLLKPLTLGYVAITPEPVETGVSNFFANLREVSNVVNNVLQLKWRKAGNDSGRFVINSTLGLGGFFDVARHAGLERNEPESFGQTLSYWGVGPGPYVMLPILGPSTLTDTLSYPVTWYLDPMSHAEGWPLIITLKVADTVDARAELLEAEKLISGDRYSFIRQAFLQRREYLVRDGEVVDQFGGDFDDFDDF